MGVLTPPGSRGPFRYSAGVRVLVTGAAGFIGSHLCQRLATRGDDVTGFDNFDAFYARDAKQENLNQVRAAAAAAGAGVR